MCPYYKWKDGLFGDYYCNNEKKVVDSTTYSDYCKKDYESGGYGRCPNFPEKSSSSGCFITTVVCDVLGMDDNNFYLEMLRKFRKEYLQKRPEGLKILEQYDTVGPIVAHCIMNDVNREDVARNAFINSIIPVVNDLCEEKNNEAIDKYINMTNSFIAKYGLDILTISVPGVSLYDYKDDRTVMGHGRLVKKR